MAYPTTCFVSKVHLGEGGVGVSDYSLRESLAEDLDKLMEASQGAKGTRAGTLPSEYLREAAKKKFLLYVVVGSLCGGGES